MYKKIPFLLKIVSCIYCAGVLSSCAVFEFSSGNANKKIDEVYKKGQANAAVKVDKKGEELVRAIVEDNGKAFLKQLPEKLGDEFGIKDFDKTRSSMVRELGTPVAYSYLRNMAHPVATISLWVIRFERTVTAANGKEEKRVMDVLFRVVYGKIDNKDTLLSFNFY